MLLVWYVVYPLENALFFNENTSYIYKNVYEIYDNYCDAAALYLIYGPI